MKLRIFKKLFFTTACVLFITLTLVFVLLSIAINDELANRDYDVLNNGSEMISSMLKQDNGVLSNETLSSIQTLTQVNKLDLYIVDHNGRISVCGCADYMDAGECEHAGTVLSEQFLNGVTADGMFELSSVGGLYEKLNYSSSKRISIDGENYYIICVSSALSAAELLKIIFGMYAVSAILPLMFMFVAEYSIVYRLTRPLKYMSIAAKSIANGDFSKRVPVMSNDEIGELSVLFNKMTDSLSRTEKTGNNFIANVSHELKTPMTTISGFIDGIIDGTIDDEKKDYYLKIVSDEVKRLSRLVQSMLNLARLESSESSLKLSKFRLSDTVLSVAISMEKQITDGKITVRGLDSLTETVIWGDADLLHQVIYNLTDNAVKFTPVGGCIDFSLHRIEDKVEFKIRNSGEGIPDRDVPHIFERFYKIDKSRSNHKNSLGLGLYICKTVVELHGGKIYVTSSKGEYTEFAFVLPTNNQDKNGEKNERKHR